MALLVGLTFYKVAAVLALAMFIFKKLQVIEAKADEDEVKADEDEVKADEDEVKADEDEVEATFVEKVKAYLNNLHVRIKDEKGELETEEYIGLLMMLTLPVSLAEYMQEGLGWVLIGAVLVTLGIVHLIELLTGYQFTNLGDLENIKNVLKEHQEKIANLEEQLQGSEVAHQILIDTIKKIDLKSKKPELIQEIKNLLNQ